MIAGIICTVLFIGLLLGLCSDPLAAVDDWNDVDKMYREAGLEDDGYPK